MCLIGDTQILYWDATRMLIPFANNVSGIVLLYRLQIERMKHPEINKWVVQILHKRKRKCTPSFALLLNNIFSIFFSAPGFSSWRNNSQGRGWRGREGSSNWGIHWLHQQLSNMLNKNYLLHMWWPRSHWERESWFSYQLNTQW
jgi:hypothetical protein